MSWLWQAFVRPLKIGRIFMKKSQGILIYGFGPYLEWTENITEKSLATLPSRPGLTKLVLPVEFKKNIFLDPIQKFNPRFVIGLGQHPRARKIRIERKAFNGKRKQKKDSEKTISPGKPNQYFMSFPFPPSSSTTLAYDAGRYVCNYSMFVIADFLQKHKEIHSGFLHIPRHATVEEVNIYLEKVLDHCQNLI